MSFADRDVASLMQRDFVKVRADELLDFVDDVMKLGRIRHMPVLEGDALVGIVSQRDLLAASLSKALDFDAGERRNFLRSVAVSEVMTKEPLTVAPSETAREAAHRMLEAKVGCLPVVEDGRVVGILTETDLLAGAYGA